MYLIVDASYLRQQLGRREADRPLSGDARLRTCSKEFPESKHIKEVDRMAQHARDYLDRNKQEDNNI